MRWYCVLCFCASLLKNSTLRLLSAIVTLTPSSRKTKSSGLGRKSGTTFGSPRGSSVYLILSLIDSLSFAPVSSPVEGKLRHREGHPMLFLVLLVLVKVPLEPRLRHDGRLTYIWLASHTFVWPRQYAICAL